MNFNKETYKHQQLILYNLQGKIQFITEALHHLNDPLTSVTGAIELVMRAVNDEQLPKAEHLVMIKRSIESLCNISRRIQVLIEESYLENKDIPGNWVSIHSDGRPKVKTILVVDDNDDVRNIMTGLLNNMGHAVMIASNGEQGINLTKMHYFDLIITDINMPNMGGVDLVNEVKSFNPWVPILIVTGFQTTKATELTKTYESVGLLNKPFKHEELKRTINDIFIT